MGKTKPVYLHSLEGELIKVFSTTQECADFFDKDKDYINHAIIYNAKIRKEGIWYIIAREKLSKDSEKFKRSLLVDKRSV